jgi:transaldolase
MNPTQALSRAGQSLWLDNITRDLLTSGTLARYVSEWSITGLTSNPTIFDQAIKKGTAYDESIRARVSRGLSGEKLFFEIALEDITRAADLFRPVHQRTAGVDGWVSLEVSPLLARDAKSTLREAQDLHARAGRPNVFIKIPGTPEGLPAIEEAIFAGVPINVTLLFSVEQYRAAAEAWLRGIERRIEANLNPDVASVASIFLSRWDVAVAGKVPDALTNTLGLAIGHQSYRAYSHLLQSSRWRRALNFESDQRWPHVKCPSCGSGWLHQNHPHDTTVTIEPSHLGKVKLRWNGLNHDGTGYSTTETRDSRDGAVSWLNAYAAKWGYTIAWEGDTAHITGPMTKGPKDGDVPADHLSKA